MDDIFLPVGAIDLFLTAAKSAFLPRVPGSLTYFQPKVNKIRIKPRKFIENDAVCQ